MVDVVVSPPQQAAAGTVLYPPVVARTKEEALVGADPSYSYVFAVAVLLDVNGNPLEGQLGGTTSVTGVVMTGSGSSGGGGSSSGGRRSLYFAFPDLYVTYAGAYTIRIDVYLVEYDDPSGARLLHQTETRAVTVHDQSVAAERATSHERSVLRRLRDLGVSVSTNPP